MKITELYVCSDDVRRGRACFMHIQKVWRKYLTFRLSIYISFVKIIK